MMRWLIASIGQPKLSRFWRLMIAASIALWLVVLIPSGLDLVSLLVFTAPAAALGVFLRWASCLFTPSRFDWRTAAHAGIASAMLLPPLLAALVTLTGLQRPEALLPLFVLGAWIALAIGLLAAALGPATERTAAARSRQERPARHKTHPAPRATRA